MALTTATTREPASNLAMAFFKWKFTVCSEIPMIIPVSQELLPRALHRRHSLSRPVRRTDEETCRMPKTWSV